MPQVPCTPATCWRRLASCPAQGSHDKVPIHVVPSDALRVPLPFGSQAALELLSGCDAGSHPHVTCVADPADACVVVIASPFASAADSGDAVMASVERLTADEDNSTLWARQMAALARAAEDAVARANATHPNVLLLEPGRWPGQHLDW